MKLVKYYRLQENELYKMYYMFKELTEAKIGAVNLNIRKEDMFDILQYLCCYWYGALVLFIVFKYFLSGVCVLLCMRKITINK